MKKGYLKLEAPHQIYYETYGNPKGVNILFLHGGPGLGFSDRDKRFFDPEKSHVIFFDQRGSGRSKPLACITNNTTQDLIADINLLLDFLQLDQVILFGGSWGSTLALLYSIQHPTRVKAMLLRGLFTASLANRAFFEKGAAALFFPEAWERYQALVPINQRATVSRYYIEQILGPDKNKRKEFAYESAVYGATLAVQNPNIDEISNNLSNVDVESKAIIQAHYSKHNFFIPDNYIFNHLTVLSEIPICIVHGRYDMICPPQFALALHQGLQNSVLYFVNAGHVSSEVEIEKRLILELRKLTS